MLPKEKAKELVNKFMLHLTGNSNNNEARECAIITVEEIIKTLTKLWGSTKEVVYWQAVKLEIKKL